jgi:hypothetical protein
MKVTTNSTGGYGVTVQSSGDLLVSSPRGSSIPIKQLSVRGSDPHEFRPLSTDPLSVHTSNGPTSPDGEAVSNDYQVEIPADADSGTYSTELEYIATAQ